MISIHSFCRTLLLSSFLYSPITNAGSSSGGGGGIAEKNLIYAYLNLATFIDMCLPSAGCRLSTQEATWLKEIKQTHALEGAVEKQLQFISGKERPGFFLIEDLVRIAKTGGEIGDIIFINNDLLYPVNKHGAVDPLSLTDAVALLIHELGHHHGIVDHQALDTLGSKVETVLLSASQKLLGSLFQQYIDVTLIYPSVGYTQVLISDDNGIQDISAQFKAVLKCTEALPSRDKVELVGAQLTNLHFVGRNQVIVDEVGPESHGFDQEAMLQGRLVLACRAGEVMAQESINDLVMKVRIHPIDSRTGSYNLVSVSAEQINCFKEASRCH